MAKNSPTPGKKIKISHNTITNYFPCVTSPKKTKGDPKVDSIDDDDASYTKENDSPKKSGISKPSGDSAKPKSSNKPEKNSHNTKKWKPVKVHLII